MEAGYNVFDAKMIVYFRNGITIFKFIKLLFSTFFREYRISKVISKKTAGWGYFKERNPKHNSLKCITFLDLKFTNS